MRKLRLIDAVALSAVALLGLKIGAYWGGAPRQEAEPSVVSGSDQLPPFAKVLAVARSNYLPPDVNATASTASPPKKEEPPPEPPKPKPPAFEPVPPPASAAERALMERLGERRDTLESRAKDLDLREKLLENAEKKLESRINDLKGMEEGAGAAAAKKGDTSEAALKNLVLMYETMKPKDAARVFDRLSLDVLVPVVLQMNPRKMAEVLAVMSPEAAEKLTVALATRAQGLNAGTPKPVASSLPGTELPAIELVPQR